MSRIGVALWLGVAPLLGCTVQSPSYGDALRGNRIRILLLGDSTTLGSTWRVTNPNGPHLEDVIGSLLAVESDLPPATVINQGRDGEYIRQLLDDKRYDRDIAPLQGIDYVVIRYGINDASRRKNFDVDFPGDYRELIARLRISFPQATLVMTTIIPFRSPDADAHVNALIAKVAKGEGLPLLDVYTRYRAELTLDPDGLSMNHHPTLAGYRVIGSDIARFLAAEIRKRGKGQIP